MSSGIPLGWAEQSERDSALEIAPRAGFWIRFAAALIDGLIVGLVGSILLLVFGVAGYLIALVLEAAYFTLLEGGTSGQGLGKRAMGIRVVDARTGGPIGYGRALVRFFGRWISSIPIALGYLWMLWDPEKQTWHDKLAKDVVVPV